MTFRGLSKAQPNAQSLLIYLLTGPHTTRLPGLLVAGEAALAEILDWPLEGFREAFRELLEKGLARADWKARVVLVPGAIQLNPPDNPNVIKGWAKDFVEVPDCAVKGEYFDLVKGFLKGFGEGFQEAFRQGFRKTLPEGFGVGLPQGFAEPVSKGSKQLDRKQEQEQEQEQEKKESPPAGGSPPVLFPESEELSPKKLKQLAKAIYAHCLSTGMFRVANLESKTGQDERRRTLASIAARLKQESKLKAKKEGLSLAEALTRNDDRFKGAADFYTREQTAKEQRDPGAREFRIKLTNFWGQKGHWAHYDPDVTETSHPPPDGLSDDDQAALENQLNGRQEDEES